MAFSAEASKNTFTGNSAPVYLDRPGYREKLKPSKRRNWLSAPVGVSTEPVMQHRKEVAWEPLFDTAKIEDEMAAHVVRLGAGMSTMAPEPQRSGGYYIVVINGGMIRDAELLPLWSMIAVEPTEAAVEIKAGPKGAEVLVLQFPRENA